MAVMVITMLAAMPQFATAVRPDESVQEAQSARQSIKHTINHWKRTQDRERKNELLGQAMLKLTNYLNRPGTDSETLYWLGIRLNVTPAPNGRMISYSADPRWTGTLESEWQLYQHLTQGKTVCDVLWERDALVLQEQEVIDGHLLVIGQTRLFAGAVFVGVWELNGDHYVPAVIRSVPDAHGWLERSDHLLLQHNRATRPLMIALSSGVITLSDHKERIRLKYRPDTRSFEVL